MRWATCPWQRLAPNCSSRSLPIGQRRRPSSSLPICRSQNGRRSSPTPAFARPCWTASPTALTSSRPEPSRTASVAPWNGRRKLNQGGARFRRRFTSPPLRSGEAKRTTSTHSTVGPLFTGRVGPSFVDRSKRALARRSYGLGNGCHYSERIGSYFRACLGILCGTQQQEDNPDRKHH